MSIESMAIALHHSKAKGTAKLVLIGIANHDGDGGAWPSISTLAKYANVTERNVQKSVRKLEALREIKAVVGEGGTHKTPEHNRPNLYHFLLQCPSECDGTSRHKVTPCRQRHPLPLSEATPPPLSEATPEPSLELTDFEPLPAEGGKEKSDFALRDRLSFSDAFGASSPPIWRPLWLFLFYESRLSCGPHWTIGHCLYSR